MSKIVIELQGDFPEDPDAKAEILSRLVNSLAEVHFDSPCRPFSETDVRMIARTKVGNEEQSLARYLSYEQSLAGVWKRDKELSERFFGRKSSF